MGLRLAALVLAAAPAYADAPVVPRFVEETAQAGMAATYAGGWEYMVGGGVAVFDCSGDGQPEVFVAGGEGSARLFLNQSPMGGALAFRAVESGLEATAVTGAYAMEIDGDGITDIVLLRVGENLAMRGLGECRFARANEDWGFDGGDGWSTAMAATWEAGADWPTIAVGNYIDRREEAFPWGTCTDNWLHRPAGRGFAPPLPLTPSYCALSMLFTDWSGSGRRDLRVSNDREYYKGGQEQLWHLDPDAPPRLYGPGEGWARLRIWGMGIAAADLDADGRPEYFLTSMADNKLQVLVPGEAPIYADQALARGVTAHRPYAGGETKPSTAWHAQFADANNDGRDDLFVAKGNVWEMPDFARDDPNNLLLQREDGTFEEAGDRAGVASMAAGRGAALADLNGDGALDLVVVNRNAPAQVWRNAGPVGGWVAVEPRQTGANPQALGAWVELRAAGRLQRQEVAVGGGHAGGVLGPLHFGLGAAQGAEVRVIWPDGAATGWTEVAGGATHLIARPAP